MDRRDFLKCIGVGTAVLAAQGLSATGQAEKKPIDATQGRPIDTAQGRPNIVYFLADDLGYADVGFMGGKEIKTPNLDKLAKSGAILESYYVQPVCSPTRASLMTGRYVAHTGVYQVVRPHAKWGLGLDERLLPQALKEAGYETAITGKWHLGEFEPAYLPTRRGFDHQYGHWFGAIDYFTHKRDGIDDWHRDDKPCDDKGYSTTLIARDACEWIRSRKGDRPIFLYVPFNAPHSKAQAPEEYVKPYGKPGDGPATFAGTVAAMDEAIGKVVAALEEKGMLANTLIIFSSDNGGYVPTKGTSNGPLRNGKGTIYEGGIRVCALASWPGKIPSGKTIKEPIHIVDWYPTLIKLAGGLLEQKLPIDGRDIWPVLTEGAKSPHDAILLHGIVFGVAAVRMGDLKLIRNAKDKPEELYNLAEDVGEKNDLAVSNPDKAKELRAKLDKLLKNAVPFGGEGKQDYKNDKHGKADKKRTKTGQSDEEK